MGSSTRVRWADAVLLALVAASLVATVAVLSPRRAGAATASPVAAPTVRLLFLTPAVGQSDPGLHVSLSRTGPATAPDAMVQLTLYSRLTTRSALDTALASPGGASGPVASVHLPASCLAAGTQLHLSIPVAPDGVAVRRPTRCGAPSPVLRLGCSAGCDGVYPLRVTVAGGGTSASIVTLLTYSGPTSTPLRVVWTVRVAGATTGLGAAGPTLRAVAQHPHVPVTLDVEGSAVATGSSAQGATASLSAIRAISRTKADELVGESYVPTDLGSLRASGLRSEVVRQFALDAVALDAAGVRAAPSRTVTYATGPVTPTSMDAMASIGFRHVLVDGADLAVDPGSTLGWGYAFHLSGAPAGPTALASDTLLSARSDVTSSDPALVASQELGELSFLHFEEPDLVVPRVAVVVTTATRQVTTSFADAMLAGLAEDPVLRAVTASTAFADVPVGTGEFPSVHALALGASAPLGPRIVSLIAFLRHTTSALSSSITAGATPIPTISGDLLTAEGVMSGAKRVAMLDHVHVLLEDELGHFRIYDGTITLTEAGATLPITIFSSAPYTVRCTLVLASQKLVFPVHTTAHLQITLANSVVSERVAARALVTGDLPMSAVLLSPKGHLVLAHSLITVRATGTSIVGIALTIVALLVLAMWWIRTSRRPKRAR